MKFLTFLPLVAAVLALSLMFISPPPVEARWGYSHHSQGRGYDHGGRADDTQNFGQANNQQWNKGGLGSRSKPFHGSRRDPATGIWCPYR